VLIGTLSHPFSILSIKILLSCAMGDCRRGSAMTRGCCRPPHMSPCACAFAAVLRAAVLCSCPCPPPPLHMCPRRRYAYRRHASLKDADAPARHRPCTRVLDVALRVVSQHHSRTPTPPKICSPSPRSLAHCSESG
jgi:hypothetical protein